MKKKHIEEVIEVYILQKEAEYSTDFSQVVKYLRKEFAKVKDSNHKKKGWSKGGEGKEGKSEIYLPNYITKYSVTK